MMKKLTFLFLHLLFVAAAFGQSTEYSVHLNSGLFSFGGESATENSFILVSDVGSIENYTNNPYGTNKALSYGLGIQIQHVNTGQHIFGFQMAYEMLQSKVNIDSVFTRSPVQASGETILKHSFISFYPNYGRRIFLQNIDIDFTVGPEFGFNLSSREAGKVSLNDGSVINTDTERSDPGTDIRLRSSATVYYKNWGISAGYSYGLHNYSGGLTGANREIFSRFIRFGLTYKMN